MKRKVVCNASPLIYAAKISIIDLFKKLYNEILIPPTAYVEVVKKGIEINAVDAFIVEKGVKDGWIKVTNLTEEAKSEVEILMKISNISRGEGEVIALAEQEDADLVIIDERVGTLLAKIRGLKVTGLLGVLIEAMYNKLITFSQLKTYFKRLLGTEFRLSIKDYEKAMKLAEKVWKKLKHKTFH